MIELLNQSFVQIFPHDITRLKYLRRDDRQNMEQVVRFLITYNTNAYLPEGYTEGIDYKNIEIFGVAKTRGLCRGAFYRLHEFSESSGLGSMRFSLRDPGLPILAAEKRVVIVPSQGLIARMLKTMAEIDLTLITEQNFERLLELNQEIYAES